MGPTPARLVFIPCLSFMLHVSFVPRSAACLLLTFYPLQAHAEDIGRDSASKFPRSLCADGRDIGIAHE